MNLRRIEITGIGACEGFSKEYFENFYLGAYDFKEIIPNKELNLIFGLGAGIAVSFYNTKKAILRPNGILECEINGIMPCTDDPNPIMIKLNEEVLLELGNFQFKMKML